MNARSIAWPVAVFVLGCWAVLFLVGPLAIVFKISFSEAVLARPPYTPLITRSEAGLALQASGANYATVLTDSLYLRAFGKSLWIALLATLIALVIALPMAYAIARSGPRWRSTLLALVLLPFWTSFLIRVYAWIAVLKDEGLLNAALLALGVIGAPLAILNTDAAVIIGIVHAYLPFMLLPIYVAFERQPPDMAEAAADLGAGPIGTFWSVTLPLAAPGIFAGSVLVLVPAIGEAIIPDLLGGADTLMIGKVMWTEFFQNRDWPVASAIAIVLLVILVVPVVWFERQETRHLQERGS